MSESSGTVYLVEDDCAVREALGSLIRSAGWRIESFRSGQDFLDRERQAEPGCLVLDVRLPGLSGLDLQDQLAADRAALPIIFISGHANVPMSVRAMKAGAFEFLTKPFLDRDLLQAIGGAVDQSRVALRDRVRLVELRARAASLTPRERDVLALVVAGKLNKQVATRLGLSEVTVKVYRARVMEKLGAQSFADLVRKAGQLGVLVADSP